MIRKQYKHLQQIPENFTKFQKGIKFNDDIRILVECGFDGFLIGEQFMREKDPGSKLKELINSYQNVS